MKRKFYSSKDSIDLGNVNTDNIIVSDKYCCTKKGSEYFVGCEKSEEVTPLCVLLPKVTVYMTNFDDAKTTPFFVKNRK